MVSAAEKQQPVKFKRVRIPVHFAGVNIGDEVGAVGITVTHEDLGDDHESAVLRAYQLLCCRRLKGILTLGKRDDGETQGKLTETDITITGTFDTNGLRVSPKAFGSRLSASLSEVSASDLAKFAKRDGYFTITSLMEAIELDDEADDEDEDRPMLAGEKKKRGKEAAAND